MKNYLRYGSRGIAKRVLLTAGLIFTAVTPQLRAEETSLSTDRIWNVYVGMTQTQLVSARFILDGTAESNGKIYNRFLLTEYANLDYDGKRVLSVTDGDPVIKFNLREEDGKVYMENPGGSWHISGTMESGDELQVFDFNAGAGDTYLSLATNPFIADQGSYGYQCFKPVKVHIRSTDYAEIDGRKLRRQYIDEISTMDGTSEKVNIQVIETIGIINDGFPMMFVCELAGAYWFSDVKLAECRNREGKLLYKNDEITLPAITDAQPIGKDTVEYHLGTDSATHLLWTLSGEMADDNTAEMKFGNFRKWKRDGDTTEVLEPEVPAAQQTVGKLVNDGYKTSLRLTEPDGTEKDYPLYDFTKGRAEEFASVMAELDYERDMPVLKSFTPIVCKIGGVDYVDFSEDICERKYSRCQHVTEVYIPSTGETIKSDGGNDALFSVLEGTGNIDFPLVYVRNAGNLKMNKVRNPEGYPVMLGENISMPDAEHQPVKLIREGREWEYVSFSDFGSYTMFYRMKFDGTEEHNGRTYHRWVTFKTTHVKHNWKDKEDGSLIDEYTVDISEEQTNVRLLREENAKVYMLTPEDADASMYRHEFGIEIPPTWTSSDVDKEAKEMILYDFNQRAGDIVQGCGEEVFPAGYYVSGTSYLTVEGEECFVQAHKPDWYVEHSLYKYPVYALFEYKMVEGIGFDGWGTMTLVPFMVTTNGNPNYSLNNVYNSQGEVIYEGKNCFVPTENYEGIEITAADRSELRAVSGGIRAAGMTSVSVYSLDGREVYRTHGYGSETFIPTAGWTKGTYVVRATGPQGSRTLKFVV